MNNLLANDQIMVWILLGVMLLILVGGYFLSMRSTKKRQEQTNNMLASIKIGTEIKTIGGIIGNVVEIDAEAGTYVIETGTGDNKSTMKIDKLAIYSVNAPVAPAAPAEAAAEEKAAEGEVAPEGKVGDADEAKSEETEAPSEENGDEEKK